MAQLSDIQNKICYTGTQPMLTPTLSLFSAKLATQSDEMQTLIMTRQIHPIDSASGILYTCFEQQIIVSTSKHQTENNNRTIRCYKSFSLNSFTENGDQFLVSRSMVPSQCFIKWWTDTDSLLFRVLISCSGSGSDVISQLLAT